MGAEIQEEKKVKLTFSEKQQEALNVLRDTKTRELLFGGGAGGAKSFLGCYWLISNCIKYPGTRWLLGRAKLKMLKQTTLNTFFDVCKMLGLEKDIHFKYNQNKGEIYLNDCTIILKDLFHYPSDPNYDSLGSLEITGAFCDEVNEMTYKAIQIVGSRIRYKVSENNLVPKILMTCNPAKNWVFNEFYFPWKNGNLKKDRQFIQALAIDNPFIDPLYISQLNRLEGAPRMRLLHGLWEYDDDPTKLVQYDAIISSYQDRSMSEMEDLEIASMTCDIATTGSDSFVICVWMGRVLIHVVEIPKSFGKEVVDTIKETARRFGVPLNRIIYDADGLGGFMQGDEGGGYLPYSHPFKNGSTPKYVKADNKDNLKSYCAFKLAEKINEGEYFFYALKNNPDLQDRATMELGQLKVLYYEEDLRKKGIIKKSEMKQALGGKSPDLLDCFIMREYLDVIIRMGSFGPGEYA